MTECIVCAQPVIGMAQMDGMRACSTGSQMDCLHVLYKEST